MSRINHVIFDWSGTLYDDHKPSFTATRDCLLQLSGHKIGYQEYKREFVLPVTRFYRKYGCHASIKTLNEVYFDIYTRHFHLGKLFDGALDALKLLNQSGIKVSIFSTVRQSLLESILTKLDIKPLIHHVTGSVCDKRREMQAHLHAIHAKASDCLYIGDMDHDVEAANANCVMSGCVLNGYHNTERLLAAKPRFAWSHQKDWMNFFSVMNLPFNYKSKVARDYPVPTSGALILNPKNEMLLVLTHKWGLTYGIPGGKIEKGETAEAACMREIEEETGLKIRIKGLICVQDSIDSSEFYVPSSHFLLFNYLAASKSLDVKLNDEALSYIWIEPKLALNLRLNRPTEILVKDYLKSLIPPTSSKKTA